MPQMVSVELISKCRNRLDAIRLCVQLSGFSNEHLADSLNIDPGHWSRIMQGRANFPDAKSVELMTLCGNVAPMQYESFALGFHLSVDSVEARKAELRAELAELEKAA